MIHEIQKAIQPQVDQLLNHPLYSKIEAPGQLQIFMQHHVFAVWDFMSLLTALQQRFTKTTSPWLPVGDPEIRYLVNEIVLAEETDLNFYGKHQSHFEMYLDAMEAAEADPKMISDFLLHVTHGTDIFLVIAASKIPVSIKQFLKTTFDVISEGKAHKIAAAFIFGREGLIPDMFSSIIGQIQQKFPEKDLKLFKYYFDRHIELDADEHGPMAYKMVENLCGNDSEKWEEVRQTAVGALKSRIELWDGIQAEIEEKMPIENRLS